MTNLELRQEEKRISKEIYELSKQYESEGIKDHHNKARCEINKKYGKGWRETLQMKMTYKKGDFKMTYF